MKYQVEVNYSDGSNELDDRIFDSEEEARSYGEYLRACCEQGAEDLYLSNPGDYPLDDYEDLEYTIIERKK